MEISKSFIDFKIIVFLSLCGLCLGSFCASFASRIVAQKRLFTIRSFCFSCEKKLGILELIPILSYVFLKGKCKHCGEKLSLMIPFCEILCAFLLVFAYFMSQNLVEFILLSLFLSLLFLLSLIDLRLKAVPEILLWSAFICAFFYVLQRHNLNLENALFAFFIRACLFGGFVFLLKSFVAFLKQPLSKNINENLGDADIIILSAIAGILGFETTFFVFFIAGILSLPFFIILHFKQNIKDKSLAMFPFLSLAFVIMYLFDNVGI